MFICTLSSNILSSQISSSYISHPNQFAFGQLFPFCPFQVKIHVSIQFNCKINIFYLLTVVVFCFGSSFVSYTFHAAYVLCGLIETWIYYITSRWLTCVLSKKSIWSVPAVFHTINSTNTLLVCFSFSLFMLLLISCHSTLSCWFVSHPRLKPNGTSIKAHICFGTRKWERWPDTKTMWSSRQVWNSSCCHW